MGIRLIGITGYKGHGKDTAGEFIATQWGYRRTAFANAVKAITIELFNLTLAQCHGTQAEKEALDPRWDLSARQIMQMVGTELGREDRFEVLAHLRSEDAMRRVFAARYLTPGDPLIWIKHTMSQIGPEDRVVITDCRFLNEAAAIRMRGGAIIRVHRNEHSASTISADPHPSETEIAKIWPDAWLNNRTGHLAYLHHQIAQMMSPWPNRVAPDE